MTYDDFRSLLKADPFRPFRIKYRTGDIFTVSKPDDAWVPPSRHPSMIYIAAPKGMAGGIDPSWITAIEFIKPRGNTRRRKAG